MDILVYTDGASRLYKEEFYGCSAYCIADENKNILYWGFYLDKMTSPRSELYAAVIALKDAFSKFDKHKYNVISDSQHLVKSFNSWMEGWYKRSWTKADGNPPEHLDCIQFLYDLKRKNRGKIKVSWVKGHNGDVLNEKADELAQTKVEEWLKTIKNGEKGFKYQPQVHYSAKYED